MMRVKRYYKRINGITYGPYYMRVDAGKSRHISEWDYRFFKSKLAEIRREKTSRKVDIHIPRRFYRENLEIYEAAGYRVRGRAVHINLKTFFTGEATAVRFGLLNKESREVIGSAQRLLELSCLAWRLHKRCNALRIKNSFSSCFAEVMKENA